MKLIIRNLDRSTRETEIKTLFQKYGSVQFCDLVLDRSTGQSKGFAFVEMPKAGEARAAMKNLNNSTLGDSQIRVKKAQKKSE